MLSSKQSEQIQTVLLRRLRSVLGDELTSVGTPLAEATASMLEVDCHEHDATSGLERLLALSDDELIELACNMALALEYGGEFDLPLGSKVSGSYPGSIEVDSLVLVLDAGRPGLFPMELVPRDAHGPNLELLRHEIERLTRKLACRRIGLPSAHCADSGSRTLLRFPPFVEAGGVSLERATGDPDAARFCAASRQQITNFAHDVVLDMRALWSNRLAVAARVNAVRVAAEQAAAQALPPASVHLIAMDMRFQRESKVFDLYVEYNAIDEALRPGTVLQFVPDQFDVSGGFARVPSCLGGRSETISELRSQGADGWIEEMAACVISAAPGGAASVLSALSTDYEKVVSIPVSSKFMFATFYWRSGCIKVELIVPGEIEYTASSDLDLPAAHIPEMVLSHLPGQTVSSVVELPFDCPCKIVGAEPLPSGGLRLVLDPDRQFVHLGSGRIWTVT